MAKYKGRTVRLNKPTRIRKGQPSYGKKKSQVFVKNSKGRVIRVTFGDPNMRIKKSSPARRKSFRARHRCATAKDRTTARYWSCKAW
jgi:intein-encoded DNA endonuclease-like protein